MPFKIILLMQFRYQIHFIGLKNTVKSERCIASEYDTYTWSNFCDPQNSSVRTNIGKRTPVIFTPPDKALRPLSRAWYGSKTRTWNKCRAPDKVRRKNKQCPIQNLRIPDCHDRRFWAVKNTLTIHYVTFPALTFLYSFIILFRILRLFCSSNVSCYCYKKFLIYSICVKNFFNFVNTRQ